MLEYKRFSGRRIPVVRVLWEHVDWVQLPAARRRKNRKCGRSRAPRRGRSSNSILGTPAKSLFRQSISKAGPCLSSARTGLAWKCGVTREMYAEWGSYFVICAMRRLARGVSSVALKSLASAKTSPWRICSSDLPDWAAISRLM